MSNSYEVYRGVNKYLNTLTNEEVLKFSKTYDTPGPAKAMATRMRFPYGKARQELSHPNLIFVESYVERATEWERI
jgi:hypothetical protein